MTLSSSPCICKEIAIVFIVLSTSIISGKITAQSWQFSNTAGSVSRDYGGKVKIDPFGNIIVCGTSNMNTDIDGVNFNYVGNFVAKYNTSGGLIWVHPVGHNLIDGIVSTPFTCVNRHVSGGVELDSLGNIYVAGTFEDTGFIGDTTISGNVGQYNAFVVKFSPSGTRIWIKYVTNNGWLNDITLDHSDNILVCGTTNGITTFDNDTITPFGTSSGNDIFFAKYNTSGALQWVRQAGGAGVYGDNGYAIACDRNDNIFVTGDIRSDANFGGLTLASTAPFAAWYNGFITKYDTWGNALWVQYCGYAPTSLEVSVDGSVYAGGYAGCGDDGFDSILFTECDKMFVTKMNNDGAYIWANSNSGGGISGVQDLALDDIENVFITGHFTDTAFFTADTLIANSSSPTWFPHMFVAKYDSSGSNLWVSQAGGADGTKTYGQGVDAVDSCTYVVSGSFLTPPAVVHEDTLFSFGDYDLFFSFYSDSCAHWAPTGLPEAIIDQADKFIIYPNPFRRKTTIKFNSATKVKQLIVTDLLGSIIYSCALNSKSGAIVIDLSDQPEGLYLCTLINEKSEIATETMVLIKSK